MTPERNSRRVHGIRASDIGMRIIFSLITALAANIIPASAQISADDALRICQEAIRRNAPGPDRPSNVVFRSLHVDQDEGARGRIEGTFVLEGTGKLHTFACSVDLRAGNLRWTQIDSRDVSTASSGSAQPVAATTANPSEKCQRAVRKQVRNHGYISVSFNTPSVDEASGTVTGRATAETGGNKNGFEFSCEMDRSTGGVRSVKLNWH